MQRKEFLKLCAWLPLTPSAMTLNELSNLASLQAATPLMPMFFIGHGSPMNGIEDNVFSQHWKKLANEIPTPTAVICISAHWLTKGTHITAMSHPKTIHDFGGFPEELYQVNYPAPGDELLAATAKELVTKTPIGLDHEWGLDHGTWTVVRHIYPKANIPVLQISIDYAKPASYHYELAKELAALRKKGVLIIGSGNMVHNLGMVAWEKIREPEYGYDWAIEMNGLFKKNILEKNHQALIDYEKMGKAAQLAIPTPDHYYPLLYILGMQGEKETISFFNDKVIAGSLTMTSVRVG